MSDGSCVGLFLSLFFFFSFFFFFWYWETRLNGNFLRPSRKMTETTLWWRKHDREGFFFFLVVIFSSSGFTMGCCNRSVFALMPKLTQDNLNKIEITEK